MLAPPGSRNRLGERGLTISTTIADTISDLLRVNGEKPTPDRKGFMSGLYGECQLSAYEKLMRGDYSDTHEVPDSHSFAKHTAEKSACYKRLLAEYPIRGKRIDGKAREPWGIHQRGLIVLSPDEISPTITGLPDDYLHYLEFCLTSFFIPPLHHYS